MYIALLHTDSRESINKALQFKETITKRGYKTLLLYPSLQLNSKLEKLGSIWYTDKDTRNLDFALINKLKEYDIRLIIPCSDSLTWSAISASMYFNLIDKTIVEPFLSKSACYELFNKAGFNTLPFTRINSIENIQNSTIEGPIFVKPDWSSGVHSMSKWGYKRFESKEVFLEKVKQDPLEFGLVCKNPYAKLMMMEYVPHDVVYCISAILTKNKTTCFGHSVMKISGEDYFYDYVLYDDIDNTKALEPFIANLWDNGFKSNFLYLQCLEKDGKLYPMDINTRLSTYLDTLVTHFDIEFYNRVLDFILGSKDSITIEYPIKPCLIGRIRSDPHKVIRDLQWPNIDGIIPLNFSKLTISNASYDKAYSWPTFVSLAYTTKEVMDNYQNFIEKVKVVQ